MKNNLPKGKFGENLASKFLRKKGYRIIAQNFRCNLGEIDLIATIKKTLAFIEVKLRHGSTFGLPEEAVTKWKIASIIKVGQYFRMLHPDLPEQERIDVVAVTLRDNQEPEIKLIENVTS